MHIPWQVLQGFGILFACVYVAWLNLFEPICTYLALNDDDWLPNAALTVSISAGLLGTACAVTAIWGK